MRTPANGFPTVTLLAMHRGDRLVIAIADLPRARPGLFDRPRSAQGQGLLQGRVIGVLVQVTKFLHGVSQVHEFILS